MSEHAATKQKAFSEKMEAVVVLTAEMEAEEGKNDTPENREKLTALLGEAEEIRKSIETDQRILGLKDFAKAPANDPKSQPQGGDGSISQPFTGGFKSLGQQLVESEAYKSVIKTGKVPDGMRVHFDAKGFLPEAVKATFDLAGTGLDSSRNYIARPVETIQQQRLTVRDLLAVGQTSQNIVYFIKETSFTNGADMVAEEGEKPEATLATTTASAPVKKIAVVLKVTDEMWNDFPMLRDYVNSRLRFMVEQKEEDQLLNGTGSGNQITGILQTSGIQTQAKGADSNFIAIHKAITKVRTPTTGGYEPDGIVLHPTDWQLLRIATDGNTQFYGGGPFYGEYGVGDYQLLPRIWGLRPVITTAISAGTALVGAFRTAAQIWQREGITVDATNTNEDDFNFNRISLRVEERLALTVYAPGAFCTVTSIA